MSVIYSAVELDRIAELEGEIANARYWVEWWKASNVPKMIEQWNKELLRLLKQYNALLDKQPIKQQ